MIACGLADARSADAVRAAAGPFVYVADKADEISQFAVGHSGALRPLKPATVADGPFPFAIAITPNGRSVYVADVGPAGAPAHKVSQYSINRGTGRLTPKSPARVTSGRGPVAIAVTPNGKNAYVVDGNTNAISQYSINRTTGKLTPKSPATVTTARNPEPIAVTPNGKYAYVANCTNCRTRRRHSPSASPSSATTDTVSEYRINQTTGALSRKPVAKVATGRGANAIAIAPDGKSLYVADGAVWQYSINPTTGKLTHKSPATVAVKGSPHDFAVAPDGKNIYIVTVTNNTVSQYRINPHTGALRPKPASSARTVLHPEAIAMTSDGKSAYVTSENNGKVSQYHINTTTGKIKPMTPATVKTTGGSLALAVTPDPPPK